MTAIPTNAKVKAAIRQGLEDGEQGKLSSEEWKHVKNAALKEVRGSLSPKATFTSVKNALAEGKREAPGYKEQIDNFVKGDLTEAVERRQKALQRDGGSHIGELSSNIGFGS